MIGVEGGVIFSELEERFLDFRRLHRLGGADHLFEEMRLSLPWRQCRDRVSEPRGMVGERQQKEPRLQRQAFIQNPTVLLSFLEDIIDPCLHNAERDRFAGKDQVQHELCARCLRGDRQERIYRVGALAMRQANGAESQA